MLLAEEGVVVGPGKFFWTHFEFFSGDGANDLYRIVVCVFGSDVSRREVDFFIVIFEYFCEFKYLSIKLRIFDADVMSVRSDMLNRIKNTLKYS